MSLNQAIVMLCAGFMLGVVTIVIVWTLSDRLDREATEGFEFEERLEIDGDGNLRAVTDK